MKTALRDEDWTVKRQAAINLLLEIKALWEELQTSGEEAEPLDPMNLLTARSESEVRASLLSRLDMLGPILPAESIIAASHYRDTD